MAVYAIGDLQGCLDDFLRLLDRLRFSPAHDRLWLTGDLVNRGPDSLGCLREVRALGDAAVTVLGNHDLHLLAAASVSKQRPGDTLDDVLHAPDRDELLAWLAARPLLHTDATLGWTLVHAGLPPEWTIDDAAAAAAEVGALLGADAPALLSRMYGDQPDRWADATDPIDRARFTINCLTRLRYVRDDGRLALKFKGAPADAPAGVQPWFAHPARRSRGARIVFGHWSTLGYHSAEGAVGIDAGCVWGGRLCALRLDATAEPVFVGCAGARVPGED